MPPARTARQRVLATNENDENLNTRVTRAKSAALPGATDGPIKKPLQAKKTTTTTQTRRPALGDVTNAGKGEAASKVVDGKKAVSKPTVAGQKLARQDSMRAAQPKEPASKPKDLKRSASVLNQTTVPPPKRRASGGRVVREDSQEADENSKPEPDEGVKIITETVTETTRYPDGSEKVKTIKREEQQPKTLSSREQARREEILAEIERMDDEDAGDPLMVSEYAYEIFEYMEVLEETTQANPNYMDGQDDLEWRMRGVLVDWLLEVHTRFHLLPETFYLTVNIIDRFLSMKKVQLDRLQLVGVTAMFIASKYEEVLSPHIGNFVHVADDGFTEAEILSAERFILQTLNFDLSGFANPMHFVRRISKADNYDIQTRTFAKYLLEITLLDHRFLAFKPSLNAAASMYLSRLILNKGPWDEILEHYSKYTDADIKPVANVMIDYLSSPVTHNAFYKKYAGKRFMKASLHARQWAKDYVSEKKAGASP